MYQVDMIRGRILRCMVQLKSYISCLPTTELEAMTRLTGQQGVETCARISDFVLTELGHAAPVTNGKGQSHRAVAKAFAGIPSVEAIDQQIKRRKKRRKAKASKTKFKPFEFASTETVTLPAEEPVNGAAQTG